MHTCPSRVVYTHSHTGGQDRPQSKAPRPLSITKGLAQVTTSFPRPGPVAKVRQSQREETPSQTQHLTTQSALQVGSWQPPPFTLAGRGALLRPGVNRHKEPA